MNWLWSLSMLTVQSQSTLKICAIHKQLEYFGLFLDFICLSKFFKRNLEKAFEAVYTTYNLNANIDLF